nr:hypothetical protein B0A51_04839 [Rachicladosporium sp. CCFEE 5018]
MSGRTPSPSKRASQRDSKGVDNTKLTDVASTLHLLDRPACMRSPPSDSERTESVAGDACAPLEVGEQAEMEDAAGVLLDLIEADGKGHAGLQRNGREYAREGGAGKISQIAISQGHPNAKIEIVTSSGVLLADEIVDIDAANTLLELSQGGHVFTEGNTRLKKGVDKYWAQSDAMSANIRNNVSSEQESQLLSPKSTAPVAKKALSPRKQCLMDMCADKPGDL